ncbi:hypothetical protein LTR02_005749 [Friedmanniomyces endolithicus]|nr:hypothetical protein LTR94_001576 [Friedmanniomyces endolithicus]KAK5143937.1 hypothetical protein LTR32_004035 [Rachicladosporium monterosium]KAK0819538.1 hypothetical protein LTR75_002060 [Friedmanniomyces endolithicus]KAK0906915.1 hypothetical protein LTR02_005749 [Friedmanniomyces endolithicus]KAK0941381.1 hypothetical protein LTR29_007068 [Friedmanniomyces endolithicus]
MAFTMSFFCVALLSLLVTLVTCRESFNYDYDRPLDGFLKVRDTAIPDYDPSEDPPPCFTLCGVVAIDSNAKRSLCSSGALGCSVLEDRSLGMILESDSNNSTDQNDIAKRTLTAVNGNNVDAFMIATTTGEAPVAQYFVWSNTDPDRHNDGLNTAMWQPFGTAAFNMVTREIHGLLNSITGTGTNKVDGPTLASVADQFTIDANDPANQQNTLHAAIMSPRLWSSTNPASFQYRTKIPAIKAAINQVIPALPIANIAAYAYVPVDAAPHVANAPASELDTTARGRVALQYDPSANGANAKGTRLIFERGDVPGTNLFEDMWTVNPS